MRRGESNFAVGTHIELERPAVARLLVGLPMGIGDRSGIHELVRLEALESFRAGPLPDPFAHPCCIDACVDNEMRNMNVLRTESQKSI